VACKGAPRDLGLDQGRFARHQIGSLLRGRPAPGWLDRWLADPHDAEVRVGRDLRRYFPHMAERTIGLSRGASVDERQLWGLLRDQVAQPSGAVLARSGELLRSLGPEGEVLIRRSAPGEDFLSIELARPGLAPALAGVNEHGLVVAGAWQPSEGPDHDEPCRAPGLLLVQDCLQRFESVEAAMEWCECRPAGGETTLVLADASGALAGVHVTSTIRQEIEPRDGLIVAPFATERAEALRKAVAETAGLDAALTQCGEPEALRVHLEPGTPRLGLAKAGGDVTWVGLEA
jgi:hypothetical protein